MIIFAKMLLLLAFESSLQLGVGEVKGGNKNPRIGERKPGARGIKLPAWREPPPVGGARKRGSYGSPQTGKSARACLSTDLAGRWRSMPGAAWEKWELVFLLLLLVAASWEILKVGGGRVFEQN